MDLIVLILGINYNSDVALIPYRSEVKIQHGDFTTLASHYHHRPGYSRQVLKVLSTYVTASTKDFSVADVGAGTGKLTEDLAAIGLHGFAVEPNDSMRSVGLSQNQQTPGFEWRSGSAEQTGLPDNQVNWVLMGSSFHWADTQKALTEFRRILKPGGHFTAIWNPRDIGRSDIEEQVEKKIQELVPNLKRKSSGSGEFTIKLEEKLTASGLFKNAFYMEGWHEVVMTPDRYKGVWNSVNDIRVQAGEEKFRTLSDYIDSLLTKKTGIKMVYKTRAWTAQVVKS